MSEKQNQSLSAATDVAEFMQELDGGMFERSMSIALSQVAAASVDNERAGEVSVKFSFTRIPGTSQVHCKHTLKFSRPTANGKSSEEEARTTALHVGKYGKLTIAPENQMTFLDRSTGAVKG